MPDDPSTTDRAGNGTGGRTHTPIANVYPLDYTQLRLLAECAAGTSAEVQFISSVGQTLQQRGPTDRGTLNDSDVVIPVSNRETRHPANEVMLTRFGNPQSRMESNPAVGTADAVFWSDAAVQKFVLPYIASCAGSGATAVVDMVQQAWSYYPDEVTVFALVHVTSFTPNTALSLEQAFQVAYLPNPAPEGGPGLELMQLDQFIATYPSTATPVLAPAPAAPVEYHRGLGTRSKHLPEYPSLRAMAEWACSIRGAPVYFLCRENETAFALHKTLPAVGLEDIVVPVQTPTMPVERPPLGGVWFQGPGADVHENLAFQGDSLFWSTGAVEQFLCPYYASKVGLRDMGSVKELADVWMAGVDAQGETVDALIHLYTSEWIVETAAQEGLIVTGVDPRVELGVVWVDASGEHCVTPIFEFMKR